MTRRRGVVRRGAPEATTASGGGFAAVNRPSFRQFSAGGGGESSMGS